MVKNYENKEQIRKVMSALERIMAETQNSDLALYNLASKEWDKMYAYMNFEKGKILPDY